MNKEIAIALAWAGAMIGTALVATVLRHWDVVSQETVIRTVAMNGLMIAWYGNRAPKVAPHNDVARRLARFSGWSFVISGGIYAALWAFAPIDTAVMFGCGAVLVGLIATMIYAYRLRDAITAEGQKASVS